MSRFYFENDTRYDQLQWNTNRNSYAICRTVPFSMNLNDLEVSYGIF